VVEMSERGGKRGHVGDENSGPVAGENGGSDRHCFGGVVDSDHGGGGEVVQQNAGEGADANLRACVKRDVTRGGGGGGGGPPSTKKRKGPGGGT
jgi:hypothetical protein